MAIIMKYRWAKTTCKSCGATNHEWSEINFRRRKPGTAIAAECIKCLVGVTDVAEALATHKDGIAAKLSKTAKTNSTLIA